MDRLSVDQLAALLRSHARGYYPLEAATELLIAHGSWLRRSEFLDHCIAYGVDPDESAWVDWITAAELLDSAGVGCSGSEGRILRLATELAGEDTYTPLPDLLTGLDDRNQQLVLTAIAHAMGNRPDHLQQGGGA